MKKLGRISLAVLVAMAVLVGAAAADEYVLGDWNLPDTVSMRVPTNPGGYQPGSLGTYFDVVFRDIPDVDPPYDIKNQRYPGWCIETDVFITPGTWYDDAAVTSTIDANPINWKAINYLVNHRTGYHWKTVQAAIWHYAGSTGGDFNAYRSAYPDAYDALIADVDGNYEDWVPAYDSVVVGAVKVDAGSNVQTLIIELERPWTLVPEFPTLAVPVGLLIGVVYTVSVIRGRKPE